MKPSASFVDVRIILALLCCELVTDCYLDSVGGGADLLANPAYFAPCLFTLVLALPCLALLTVYASTRGMVPSHSINSIQAEPQPVNDEHELQVGAINESIKKIKDDIEVLRAKIDEASEARRGQGVSDGSSRGRKAVWRRARCVYLFATRVVPFRFFPWFALAAVVNRRLVLVSQVFFLQVLVVCSVCLYFLCLCFVSSCCAIYAIYHDLVIHHDLVIQDSRTRFAVCTFTSHWHLEKHDSPLDGGHKPLA